MANYIVRVTRGGQPVAGAVVRIVGVGIDDTDATGVAQVPIAGTKRLTRGTRYAARIGKAAGTVADEPDLLDLVITAYDGSGKEIYTGGHRVAVTPYVQTDVELR